VESRYEMMKTARALETGLRRVEKALLYLAVGMLWVMVFWGTAHTVARYLFASPIRGTGEASQLLMAGVALLCLGYVQSIKSHISVNILVSRYPPRVQAIASLIGLLLTIVVFALIAWQSTLKALQVLEQGRMLYNFPTVPVWPFRLLVPFGASILCLESIIQAVHLIPEIRGKGKMIKEGTPG
jgi:TRAP-type C4-dicarboxylate transport system permease small subunit